MLNKRVLRLASKATILILLLSLGMSAQAATLKVCECKACGCQYLDIQEAINRAQPGDTVLVRSGTFHKSVDVNKPIILSGFNWKGLGVPVIDVGGSGSAIIVSADGATIKGFVVTNSGNLIGDAGIKVISDNCTVKNNVIERNNWAGICLEAVGNETPSGNIIEKNEVRDNPYGICLLNSFDNLIFANRFFNNTEINAFDNRHNQWDLDGVGNYYGDFNCTDEDNDTICDSAYNITGGTSVDAYPFAS